MSLAIDIDRVTAVLIAGDWHEVAHDASGVSTFDIDAYEFMGTDERAVFRGGQSPPIPSTGFVFATTSGEIMAGPLTSVQAVKFTRR